MQNNISCCKSTVFVQFIKHLRDFFFQSRYLRCLPLIEEEVLLCLDRLLHRSRETAPSTTVASVCVVPHPHNTTQSCMAFQQHRLVNGKL